MNSRIKKKGDASPFVLAAPQTFGLRESGAESSAAEETVSPKRPDKSKPEKPARVYSFAEAAEKVLEEFGDKRPMHVKAITKKALEQGWLDTQGKTPDATMGAQLYMGTSRNRFFRVA